MYIFISLFHINFNSFGPNYLNQQGGGGGGWGGGGELLTNGFACLLEKGLLQKGKILLPLGANSGANHFLLEPTPFRRRLVDVQTIVTKVVFLVKMAENFPGASSPRNITERQCTKFQLNPIKGKGYIFKGDNSIRIIFAAF